MSTTTTEQLILAREKIKSHRDRFMLEISVSKGKVENFINLTKKVSIMAI
jgi:hypothetical protein